MTALLNLNMLRGTSAFKQLEDLIGPEAKADIEVANRVRSLRRGFRNQVCTLQDLHQAQLLTEQLKDQYSGTPFDNPVNPVFFRQEKMRIIPHVVQLAEQPDYGPVTVATAIPRQHLYSMDELTGITAHAVKARFRAALNRAGAGKAKGWLIAGLHGSYDLSSHLIQLHWHMVVAGEMIEVVDALRNGGSHQSQRNCRDDEVFQRVKIRRRPVDDWARAASYILQAFWSCRWVMKTEEGNLTRLSQRRRIPEPDHARWLLWMSKQSLSDLILPMGLTVQGDRLMARK